MKITFKPMLLATVLISNAGAGLELTQYDKQETDNIIAVAAHASAMTYARPREEREALLDWLKGQGWTPDRETTKMVRVVIDSDVFGGTRHVTEAEVEKEVDVGFMGFTKGTVNLWAFKGSSDLPEVFWGHTNRALVPVSTLNGDVNGFMSRGRVRVPDAAFHGGYGQAFFTRFAEDLRSVFQDTDSDITHIFTGHSMGGAFAQMGGLFAGAIQTGEALGRENLSVITFGSARPFNEGAAAKFDALFPGACYARAYDIADPIPDKWADTHRSGTGIDLSINGGFAEKIRALRAAPPIGASSAGAAFGAMLGREIARLEMVYGQAHGIANYLAHAPRLPR